MVMDKSVLNFLTLFPGAFTMALIFLTEITLVYSKWEIIKKTHFADVIYDGLKMDFMLTVFVILYIMLCTV